MLEDLLERRETKRGLKEVLASNVTIKKILQKTIVPKFHPTTLKPIIDSEIWGGADNRRYLLGLVKKHVAHEDVDVAKNTQRYLLALAVEYENMGTILRDVSKSISSYLK